MRYSRSTNHYPERALDDLSRQLGNLLGCEVMAIFGELVDGVDDAIKESVEWQVERGSREKLCVVLTTNGGFIEVVERIVGTLRHHYDVVEFVVPNFAYSAGTVLALSGDAIHMSYYSRLGPIDPQVRTESGRAVPAMGYLARYEEMLDRVVAGNASPADLVLLTEFDQAELYSFEQARKLAVRLVAEWLKTYKLPNYESSQPEGQSVSDMLRRDRATDIASQLSDADRWNSHGYGISMTVLRNMGLEIDDFGTDEHLKHAIEDFDGLLRDYLHKRELTGALHIAGRLVRLQPFISRN